MPRLRPAADPLAHLRKLEARYRDRKYLDGDPIGLVWELPAEEREVGAFLAALLAYGNVKSIRTAVRNAYARLDGRPGWALREWSGARIAQSARGFVHRWTQQEDWGRFLRMVRGQLRGHGTLALGFQAVGNGPLPERAARWIASLHAQDGDRLSRGLRFLIPSPVDGGAAKRLWLFLKWMARPAFPDLGLWTFLDPAELIIPLDTHLARIARNLGWTARRAADGRTAQEVTRALRQFDPSDPTRYDFAVSRMGILRECPPINTVEKGAHHEYCRPCGLRPLCRLAAGGGPSDSQPRSDSHAQPNPNPTAAVPRRVPVRAR